MVCVGYVIRLGHDSFPFAGIVTLIFYQLSTRLEAKNTGLAASYIGFGRPDMSLEDCDLQFSRAAVRLSRSDVRLSRSDVRLSLPFVWLSRSAVWLSLPFV
jgi:hypothetical protein